MSIEEVQSELMKRSGGRCEWVEKKRVGYRFEDFRCDEVHGTKAKKYKGTVHLQVNHKSTSKKYIKEELALYCWKHTIANDKIIKKPPRVLKKKRDPDQISLLDQL